MYSRLVYSMVVLRIFPLGPYTHSNMVFPRCLTFWLKSLVIRSPPQKSGSVRTSLNIFVRTKTVTNYSEIHILKYSANLQRRSLLLDSLAFFEGQAPLFSITDIFHAIAAVRRSNRYDHDRLSMSALIQVSHARHDLVADAVFSFLSSRKAQTPGKLYYFGLGSSSYHALSSCP